LRLPAQQIRPSRSTHFAPCLGGFGGQGEAETSDKASQTTMQINFELQFETANNLNRLLSSVISSRVETIDCDEPQAVSCSSQILSQGQD
jgi:hypothetical protein